MNRRKIDRHSQCRLGSEPNDSPMDKLLPIRKLPQTDITLKNHTHNKSSRNGTASTKSESVSSLGKETPSEEDILQMAMMSPYSIKKFIGQEAGKILSDPSANIKRQKRNRKLLERVKLPDVVTRNKSTSAIFKDYHEFRTKKYEEVKPSINVSKLSHGKGNVFIESNAYQVLPPICKK